MTKPSPRHRIEDGLSVMARATSVSYAMSHRQDHDDTMRLVKSLRARFPQVGPEWFREGSYLGADGRMRSFYDLSPEGHALLSMFVHTPRADDMKLRLASLALLDLEG